jgi:putative nucleotidyltransferase with HDIG domain
MNARLGAHIAFAALVSSILLAGVVLLSPYGLACPFGLSISIDRAPDGIWAGALFWVLLALTAASLPVRLPDGIFLDVSFAPVLAAANLGGPAAAGIVALFGTTQSRELRHEVPWYGVVANHCSMVAPAIIGSVVLQMAPGRTFPLVDLLWTTVAGSVYFSLNILMAATFVSLREGEPVGKLLRSAAGAFVNMLALAPVAWLMAQMYTTAGFWAVLVFAVPLWTTRRAYASFVEVREMFTETVRSLAEAVNKRDVYTSGHSNVTQEIAMDIGRVMKVSDAEMEALEWGALLHDIGKIGVPDAVLLKQGRLTREERTIMNMHPILGAEIIAPVSHLAPVLPIIRHHHEWFNGSGYPDRLVADEIPKLARIIFVADAFEAMTAKRPYRLTPLTPEEALAELRKFGGIQFDPDVVDAFVKTKWARGVADPGRDEIREVPLIGQTAGTLASAGRTPGAP